MILLKNVEVLPIGENIPQARKMFRDVLNRKEAFLGSKTLVRLYQTTSSVNSKRSSESYISAPYRVGEQKFKNSLKHAMVKFIKQDILHQNGPHVQ